MIKWSCPLTVKFQHATGEVVLQLVWCSRSSEATRSFRNSKQILANMSAKVLASTHQLSCFPCSSVSKESACSAGDPGSIPGSGRFPGEGNSNTLQYSCLENLIDSGDWWASVHGVCKESSMTERLTLTSSLTDFSWMYIFEKQLGKSAYFLDYGNFKNMLLLFVRI